MADHNRAGRRTSVSAAAFAIGAWSLAIPAWAQEKSAVPNSTNDLGIEFVSIPAGQFPMGCSEGAKPVECSADERPRHTVQITKAFDIGKR
jgi:formylglycine-generating enzyme required for sulfatase activity